MTRLNGLARRERQIMDIVFRLGRATVNDVMTAMPDPPSYSAVRTMLRRLEDKGFLRHQEQGRRHLFSPRIRRQAASRAALESLVETFFDGSPTKAAAALLDMSAGNATAEELRDLWKLVDQARKEGR